MEQQIASMADNGIYALEQMPKEDSPVIVLAHGINSDLTEDRSANKPGLFDMIVDRARESGLGTIRFDFRGHGKSAAVEGYVSISSEIADLRKVIEDAEIRGRNVQGMVAASFGACAACEVVSGLATLKSLVLVNPVLRPRETFLEPGSQWARRSINQETIGRLAQTGELMLDGTFPLGSQFMQDLRAYQPSARLSEYPGALAILHGTADTYVPFRYSRDFAAEHICMFAPVLGSEHGFGVLRDRDYVADEAVRFARWAIGL